MRNLTDFVVASVGALVVLVLASSILALFHQVFVILDGLK